MNTNKKTPKLRFKGFTDDWEQRQLGECMNSFAYGLNAAAKNYDGMHKYIRITDIDDETHNFIQSNLTSPDIDFNMDVSDYKLNVGDIVFARTGASVGKTYLYNPNDGDLYYAGFLIRGKVKEDCDAGFIYQNTLTKEYDSFIRITSQRSGQPGVNSKEYATFRLNIPCKDEQEKISKILNCLDELFTLHQRKLEKLKLNKSALLQKLFPQNGCTIPEVRFKGFTDAWEQRKLVDVAVFNPKEELPDVFEYVDLESVVGTEMLFHRTEEKSTAPSRAQRLANNGDLFYQTVRPYQKNNYLFEKSDKHYVFSTGYTQLRPFVDGYFLLSLVQNGQFVKSVLDKCTGTSYPAINANDLAKIEMFFPKDECEHHQIGTYFRNLDSLITLHQRKLDKLKNIKKSMLDNMFV